jgi:ribosomal protein S18 acetylase RimI-like enzyme
MQTPRIRRAGIDDMAALDAGLRALSADLGHTHRAGVAELADAALAPHPPFVGLLAEAAPGVVGVALLSPLFSTVRGAAGAYVSDLWVARDWRGRRLGEHLLAAARDTGATLWRARFLRLGVAHDNARARAFYDRLGFSAMTDETMMTLTGEPLAALEGAP